MKNNSLKYISLFGVASTLFLVFSFNIMPALPKDGKEKSGEDSTKHTTANLDSLRIMQTAWNSENIYPYKDGLNAFNDTVLIVLDTGCNAYFVNWFERKSSPFGQRWGRLHKGIDLTLDIGDKVFAALGGVVRFAKYNDGGYGNLVIIRHYNGLETYYAHLDKIKVKPNQVVKAGDVIGLGGSTGRSYGAHLHFEVRYHDFTIDPEKLFDFNTLKLSTDTLIITRQVLHHS